MADATIKDEARELINRLPEDATWEDLQYEIYVRQAIETGLKDSREGRTVPLDEARHQYWVGRLNVLFSFLFMNCKIPNELQMASIGIEMKSNFRCLAPLEGQPWNLKIAKRVRTSRTSAAAASAAGDSFLAAAASAVDQQHQADPEEEKQAHFTKVIFGDTERVWDEQFRKMGKTYKKPILHLYTDQVQSGCGSADASVGPFYCPADEKVYIDLSFYRDMQKKLNAPGEFAHAYVVAHEVGHHVQKLLGYTARAADARGRDRNSVEAHHMSVRVELQADYLAGVWAHHGQEKYHFLQKGDIESAMKAAFEIGDDRLQRKARGTVQPDTFTHGTSKQRQKWFGKGFQTGDVNGAKQLFELKYEEL